MDTLKFWSSIGSLIKTTKDNILEYDPSYLILQAVFDSAFEGIIVTDENLLIRMVNTKALKILGVKEDTLCKLHINSILKEDTLNSILLTGENRFSEDCSFYIGDNRIRCVTNIFPIKLREKNIGLVLSLRDTKHLHKMVNNVVGYKASFTFDDIITKNEKMKNIINFAKRIAKTNCNVLIEGNSGTGKEVFAQSIHNYSSRHTGPFVAVNCAAIPRELVESELFGYEKGAFTGASKGGYPGKFELAEGGTIFLDEIGELPLDIQTKLLRVLDNLKIVRVGGTYEKSVDVRVIAATNKILTAEIENKNFREDLYYRLNVMNLQLIPLEERKVDIELLAQYFVNKLNSKNPCDPKYIDTSYIDKLKNYSFDGNIRELRNMVERSYYLCEENLITSKHLSTKNSNTTANSLSCCSSEEIFPLEVIEEQYIRNAIKHCKGNAIRAAELLKISKATIYRKINKFNIDLNSFNL